MSDVENLQKKVVGIAEAYADMVQEMIESKRSLADINEELRMLNHIASTLYKLSASGNPMTPDS